MSNVKTAISLREPLLREVDALARQMHVPRSQVFVMALEGFIQQRRNQQLLKQINRAYAHEPDPAERNHLARMRRRHRQLVEGQW